MSVIDSIVRKIRNWRSLYFQILFVTLAFALMVVSSGVFVYNILANYLEREAQNRLDQTQIRITNELREVETLMIHVVKDVRDIIMAGGGVEDVQEYFDEISAELLDKEEGFIFDGLLGCFDVFDNAYITSPVWAVPDSYDALERPWYKKAVEGDGKISITSMFTSARTGERVINTASRIFDNKGRHLGVVAISIEFKNITEFVSEMSVIEGGRGLLADDNFITLVHPGEDAIGKHMSEIAAGPREFVKIMEQGGNSARLEDINFWGESAIFYFTRLDNGWVLWLMTPRDIYYKDLENLIWFLGFLGVSLMAVVDLILIRLDTSKKRMDERVQLMLDAAPFGVTLLNKDYEIIDCNKAALSMVGLAGEKEKYKKRFVELTSPVYQPNGERSDDLMRKYIDMVFEKQISQFKWTHLNLEGEFIPCEVNFARIPYKNQEIAVAYTRDLREELKMQEKEREAQAAIAKMQMAVEEKNALSNLGNILDSLDTMIYVTDPYTDEILFINDNMRRHYGIENDVVGQLCYKILQEGLDEKCSFCPCFQLDKEPGSNVVWEERGTKTNRIYRNVDRYINWPNGRMVHLQHSIDITDLSTMSDALKKRLEQQSLMTYISQSFLSPEDMNVLITKALEMVGEFMEIDQILVFIMDDGGNSYVCRNEWLGTASKLPTWIGEILTVHEAFQDTFLKIKEQKKFYVTSNDSDTRKSFSLYKTYFSNYIITFVFIDDELYAIIDFSRLGDEKLWNKDEINMACYATNVLFGAFKRHSAELQLVDAKEAAEQSNRAKGIFLAQMSHEIRTPMNAILGISEIQLQDKKLTPDTEEAFRQIYDSGNLLLNIINDILDFSKIEAGKMEIVSAKYNIPSMINDTVQLNLLRYQSKPLEFKLDLNENTPVELSGDELRIKQILNNLLSNAFKYTDKGEINLSVYIERGNDEGMVILVFRVSDTGQGMGEDQVNKLFDEYSRFNMEKNRGITGTGLGMSIAKRLLDMMGGEIFVQSKLGEGSTFIVRLPQKDIGSAACGAELADTLQKFRFRSTPISKKAQIIHEYMPYGSVLVVDDVASNLYVAKGMLSSYGLHVDTVVSGIDAIERIKDGSVYDIVFMDHMMPEMDGMEAVKIIREMGYARPIVALTANAVAGQSEIFLANGFDGFISKPIDSRGLDAALKHFIRDKQPREVIEATRREQIERENENSANPAPVINEDADIGKYFVLDAKNAIEVMEETFAKLPEARALNSYTTAVHGMKNVLANIGEAELSSSALRLEQAGKEEDLDVIKEETSAFLDALRFLIEKYKPADDDETVEISGEDNIYLRDKLSEIKTACEKFDVTAAKDALDSLRKKTWPRYVNETLDEISVHLLHSAFKKAAQTAGNTAKV